jgi:hypothetical protein
MVAALPFGASHLGDVGRMFLGDVEIGAGYGLVEVRPAAAMTGPRSTVGRRHENGDGA